MVINIDDAVYKYEDWIARINKFEHDLTDLGAQIEKQNDFELGGEWTIRRNGREIGQFVWNVPHIIRLEVDSTVLIDEDYLKDCAMWIDVIDDAAKILTDCLLRS